MTDRESRLRGVILMVVAVGAFSVMDALMKHLAASYPPMQIAFLRGASSLPFVFLSYAVTRRLGEDAQRRGLTPPCARYDERQPMTHRQSFERCRATRESVRHVPAECI